MINQVEWTNIFILNHAKKILCYTVMMQQIYRKPPCIRAISIKLCSNSIEIAQLVWLSSIDLLILTAFIQSTLEKLLFAAIKNTLDKLLVVILSFLQVHKHTSSFVFVYICTENKIQLQTSSKHIYSNKQWTY